MEPGLVGFLTVGWRLLELADPNETPRLIDVWRERYRHDPDFGEDGDATIGYLVGSHDPGEGFLLVGRTANDEALRSATRLLTLRHGLAHVHPVGRPMTEEGEDDWRPLDPSTVTPGRVRISRSGTAS